MFEDHWDFAAVKDKSYSLEELVGGPTREPIHLTRDPVGSLRSTALCGVVLEMAVGRLFSGPSPSHCGRCLKIAEAERGKK